MKDSNRNNLTKDNLTKDKLNENDLAKIEKIKSEFGNTNSKEIFQNKKLCAQFLRGHTGISLFEHIEPENIEDITDNLRPFVGVEYEGDAIMRIHLPNIGRDIYVVGLFEHKSTVDYDVSFQLLKYMVGIWAMYRNHENKIKHNSSALKKFRYPLIIPFVYYEGKDKWTAAMHWKNRVQFSEEFGQFVPDFTYKLVELHDYTNEGLLSREEELSLIMLLNRVQTEEDLDLSKLSEQQRGVVEKIVQMAPDDVLHIMAEMIYHLGLKLALSDEKLMRYIKNVEDRDMGELWANMDHINVPKRMQELDVREQGLEKREQELDEQKQELDEQKQELDEQKQELDEREQGLNNREHGLDNRELELVEEKKSLNEQQDSLNKEKRQLVKKDEDLSQKDKELSQKDKELSQKDKELFLREKAVAEKEKALVDTIADLKAEIERLKKK